MAAKHEQLVKRMEKKLEASHTAMERKMLDIKWQDHVPNKTVKAGHVSRMTNNWAHDLTMWKPHGKRNRGRPKKHWAEAITKHLGRRKNWAAVSQDCTEWRSMDEAFILRWR